MKSFKNLLTLFAALSAMAFMTSCGDDDIVIDPGTGISVADGFYIAAVGADPVAAAQLSAENVDASSFGSQARSGFVANYVYLTAGDYQIVQIASKEKTATLGAAGSVESDDASGCGLGSYTLAVVAADGAGFAAPNNGLYKVTYDEMTKEVVLHQIEKAGIIGDATVGGWGTDTELPGTIGAEGASWSAENVELKKGAWKYRFNCRWSINRQIGPDPDGLFEPSNGYQLFTNFGGGVDDLKTGNDGDNIGVTTETSGKYTITIDWSPVDGWSASATKTGELDPVTFVPSENQWAITGSATPNGWPNDDPDPAIAILDHDFNYEGQTGDTHTWKITIDLIAGAFKIRANDEWSKILGFDDLTMTGADSADFTKDGDGNVVMPAAGNYTITLTTSDDGATYSAEFMK